VPGPKKKKKKTLPDAGVAGVQVPLKQKMATKQVF
jgi:hypothetical protein